MITINFIENILVNLLILLSVLTVYKEKVKYIKLIVYLILVLIIYYYFNENILLYVFMHIILFNIYIIVSSRKKLLYIIKLNLLYISSNLVYLSVVLIFVLLTAIDLNMVINRIYVYIISFILIIVFNILICNVFKEIITYNNLTYFLNINGKKYKLYLDTGNFFRDYNEDVDVIFLDELSYLNKNNSKRLSFNSLKKVNIEVSGLNNSKIQSGYEIKDVHLNKFLYKDIHLNKVIILFSEINIKNYDGIIGLHTYLKLL